MPQDDLLARLTAYAAKSGGSGATTAPTTPEDYVNKYSTQYGVDPNLVRSVMKTESGGVPAGQRGSVTSKKGAVGFMQIKPETAAQYGVTDVTDPEQNINAGVQHLKYLSDKYNGDVTKTVAAYNAGEGNVAKYGGVPPFKETQDYVNKVTQNLQAQQPIATDTTPSGTTVSTTASGGVSMMDRLKAYQLKQNQEQSRGSIVQTPQAPETSADTGLGALRNISASFGESLGFTPGTDLKTGIIGGLKRLGGLVTGTKESNLGTVEKGKFISPGKTSDVQETIDALAKGPGRIVTGLQTGDPYEISGGIGESIPAYLAARGAVKGGVEFVKNAPKTIETEYGTVPTNIKGKVAPFSGKERLPSEALPEVETMANALGGKTSLNLQKNLQDNFEGAKNDLVEAEKTDLQPNYGRKVQSQKELEQVSDTARKNVWSKEVQPWIDRAGPMPLDPVADDVIKALPEGMELRDPQGYKQLVDGINQEFRGKSADATMVEKWVQSAHADRRSVLAQNNFDRIAAEKTDTGRIAKAYHDSLKDNLYKHVADKTTQDIRPQLQRYGNLTDIQQHIGTQALEPTLLELLAGRYTSPTSHGLFARGAAAVSSKWVGEDAQIKRAFNTFRDKYNPDFRSAGTEGQISMPPQPPGFVSSQPNQPRLTPDVKNPLVPGYQPQVSPLPRSVRTSLPSAAEQASPASQQSTQMMRITRQRGGTPSVEWDPRDTRYMPERGPQPLINTPNKLALPPGPANALPTGPPITPPPQTQQQITAGVQRGGQPMVEWSPSDIKYMPQQGPRTALPAGPQPILPPGPPPPKQLGTGGVANLPGPQGGVMTQTGPVTRQTQRPYQPPQPIQTGVQGPIPAPRQQTVTPSKKVKTGLKK